MGKIRIAKLGGGEEEKLRKRQKVRREEKKKREKAQKVRISGMKGGERIRAVTVETDEELEKLAKITSAVEKLPAEDEKKAEKKAKAKKKAKRKSRSKKYQELVMKIDPGKLYSIIDALPLLRQVSIANFDASVELHINTTEKGLRGSVALPHGTGKKVKVMIADASNIDELIEDIRSGKINFDILIAHPLVMGKLAKVAKFLGPRGLMPNPKTETISEEPEKIAQKFKKGELNWKTESQFPIVHLAIGKLSFKDQQLAENFDAVVKSIGTNKVKNITLKSTISPGIKVNFD